MALVTGTGPGAAVLRTAEEKAAWNATAGRRWSRLRSHAQARVIRRFGRPARIIATARQLQKRGVWHLHAGVAAEPADRAVNDLFVSELKRLGPQYGFGWIDDPYKRRVEHGKSRTMVFDNPIVAGAYVARYLTRENDPETWREWMRYQRQPRQYTIARDIQRETRITMRTLRRTRHAYCVLRELSAGRFTELPVWWSDDHERAFICGRVTT